MPHRRIGTRLLAQRDRIAERHRPIRLDVQAMIRGELAAMPSIGTNQHSAGCDNVTPSDRGNTSTYALRRLKRDRPDLAAQVVAGTLTANAAAPGAGTSERAEPVAGRYSFETFEEYVEQRWDIKYSRADQTINAAIVAEKISTTGGGFIPARERHVRPLLALDLYRRHLSESQRAMVAAKVANLGEGRPSQTAPIGALTQDAAADLLNVGRRSVQRAREVISRHGGG